MKILRAFFTGKGNSIAERTFAFEGEMVIFLWRKAPLGN